LAQGYPETLVDQAVAEAAREGVQSDARYAEALARGRIGKGYGVERVRRELRRRGIAREAEPDYGEWDWDGLLAKVYSKKYGDLPPASASERAARERFLLYRGFGRDQIRRLFRRLERGGTD
jgi:regulatory protein